MALALPVVRLSRVLWSWKVCGSVTTRFVLRSPGCLGTLSYLLKFSGRITIGAREGPSRGGPWHLLRVDIPAMCFDEESDVSH